MVRRRSFPFEMGQHLWIFGGVITLGTNDTISQMFFVAKNISILKNSPMWQLNCPQSEMKMKPSSSIKYWKSEMNCWDKSSLPQPFEKQKNIEKKSRCLVGGVGWVGWVGWVVWFRTQRKSSQESWPTCNLRGGSPEGKRRDMFFFSGRAVDPVVGGLRGNFFVLFWKKKGLNPFEISGVLGWRCFLEKKCWILWNVCSGVLGWRYRIFGGRNCFGAKDLDSLDFRF